MSTSFFIRTTKTKGMTKLFVRFQSVKWCTAKSGTHANSEQVDTVWSAAAGNGFVCHPKASPDGRTAKPFD